MLFVVTVFLAAFLLFQVQPLVAKLLLPWFGGTPMVWTICQMFFQCVLLAGYIYAHALTRRGRPWRQYWIHLGVLLAAGAGLIAVAAWSGAPLLADESMRPSIGVYPGLQLFTVLVITVGLPAFAVSTTGPLLQSWHARTTAPLAGTYRLYAVSNAGSLIGLLSYPVVVERLLTLTQQAWLWAAAFAVFATGAAIIARRAALQPESSATDGTAPESPAGTGQRISAASVVMWLLLGLVGSAVLLATTSHLSQDVAAAPFLWVLPLAIYLITFIICFEHPFWYSRDWMLALAVAATIWAGSGVAMPFAFQLAANGLFVFSFCMLCHGELVRRRPDASHLTTFYVVIAMGGALGGVLVGVAAPLLLPNVWEFHLTIVVGWLVVALAWWNDRTSPFFTDGRRALVLCVATIVFLAVRYAIERTRIGQVAWILAHSWTVTAVAVTVPALAAPLLLWRSTLAHHTYWSRAVVGLAFVLAAAFLVRRVTVDRSDAVYTVRNFYGVVRVLVNLDKDTRSNRELEVTQLLHGTTLHGVQVNDVPERYMPTSYYSRSSGVAAAINLTGDSGSTRSAAHLHLGVVGMGVGTLSAYARAGDRVRYYEINPDVVAIARGPEAYFTFIRDSPAAVTIVPGDARQSLERERAAGDLQQFDVLAVDAFSGDSVPLHLITREAFRAYAAHLRNESSILAVHVTNNYLDLEPVIAANAMDLGFFGVDVDTAGDPPVPLESSWILLSRRPFDARDAPKTFKWRPMRKKRVSFTDQYSNLFRVLKTDSIAGNLVTGPAAAP